LYSQELLTALAELPQHDFRFELVTSQDIDPQFRSGNYPVANILPPLRHRREFSTRAAWIASRLTHYSQRESTFIRWLKTQDSVAAVHFQLWTPWLAASVFRRIRSMGIRVHYTVHNLIPHQYPALIPKPLMHRWIRRGCRAADGLLVHTPGLASQLGKFLGAKHPPIHVTPHGAWTIKRADGHATLADRLAKKKLLFFGAIRQNKGLHVLLDAARSLPGFSLTIAGEPGDTDYFHNELLPRIHRLRTGGMNIDLLDRFIPDAAVPELFASHSAVVMPYTSGFVAQSGVVFMALACHTPAIATRSGGLPEFFDRYPIGVTVDQVTSQAVARTIQTFFATADCAQLHRRFEQANQELSWRRCAEATVTAYRESLKESRVSDDCLVSTIVAH
jgi:glycosyltransferase involved in cell wall biosynthesis